MGTNNIGQKGVGFLINHKLKDNIAELKGISNSIAIL